MFEHFSLALSFSLFLFFAFFSATHQIDSVCAHVEQVNGSGLNKVGCKSIYLEIHIHVPMIGDGDVGWPFVAIYGMRMQENKYACEIFINSFIENVVTVVFNGAYIEHTHKKKN